MKVTSDMLCEYDFVQTLEMSLHLILDHDSNIFYKSLGCLIVGQCSDDSSIFTSHISKLDASSKEKIYINNIINGLFIEWSISSQLGSVVTISGMFGIDILSESYYLADTKLMLSLLLFILKEDGCYLSYEISGQKYSNDISIQKDPLEIKIITSIVNNSIELSTYYRFFSSQIKMGLLVPAIDTQSNRKHIDVKFYVNNSANITSDETMSMYALDKIALKEIIENLPGHVYWKDRESRFLGCNLLQAKSAGYNSVDKMIGKKANDFPWHDYAEKLFSMDKKVIESGRPITVEEPGKDRDGNERVFLTKKVPLRKESEIIGVLGISFDITDQKDMERALNKTSDQLTGMKLLAASIAHEMRSPLSSIRLHSDGVYKKLHYIQESTTDDSIKGLLAVCLASLCRLRLSLSISHQTIDMILANMKYNRLAIENQELLSISDCLVTAMATYSLDDSEVEMVDFMLHNDFKVHGDKSMIVNVIHNLLKNALFSIKSKGAGKIHISMDSEEKKLIVYDTGVGIEEKIIPVIFDQFVSGGTKHGAGIGLAYCKAAMEAHNGSISCESCHGKYTKFILSFNE